MKMRRLSAVLPALLLAAILAGCTSKNKDLDNSQAWTAERFYNLAKRSMEKKNYRRAIEMFRQLEARFPYGKYAEQAQLEVIYAYYKSNDSEAALAAADRFINVNPTHINVDYAYYMKGLATFKEDQGTFERLTSGGGQMERDIQPLYESYDAFKELITRYPNSRYAADAETRMAHLVNSVAAQEIKVAEYYFRREAYVAVINRCETVLDLYQQSPAVEDALALMVRAYRRMEMSELAEDAERVLKTNFPDSEYLADNTVKEPRKGWRFWRR